MGKGPQVEYTPEQKERIEKMRTTFWFFRVIQIVCALAMLVMAWVFLDQAYLDGHALLNSESSAFWLTSMNYLKKNAVFWVICIVGFFASRAAKEHYEEKLYIEQSIAQQQAAIHQHH